MVTRRTFIRKSGLALTAAAVVPSLAFKRPDPKTGLILYTVRQDMTRDAAGTIAAVGAMGYKWIEAAGYSPGKFHGLPPAEFSKLVKDNGMRFISTHNSINRENAGRMTDDAAAAGLKIPHTAFIARRMEPLTGWLSGGSRLYEFCRRTL